ncbi:MULTISPECIES: Crp/Fnr family transcriptional regulator, partial [unclassified Undibacterium]|uniref:Crp/Fnr family transcriptional regulator n=2 Tax=unclassified Undibacterium TaxID=2630295 RepID=UPI002B2351A0
METLLNAPSALERDLMFSDAAYAEKNLPAALLSLPSMVAYAAKQQLDKALWQESLSALESQMVFTRRKLKIDEKLYLYGERFERLYLVSSGLFKLMNLSVDGREQAIGLYFKGDWLGFDGISGGCYSCSAVALDRSEVWVVNYERLLQIGMSEPRLLRLLFRAMGMQLGQHRNWMLSMGTLPSDARVCDFLLQWANALAERGLRTDQFNVHLSRADIGNLKWPPKSRQLFKEFKIVPVSATAARR